MNDMNNSERPDMNNPVKTNIRTSERMRRIAGMITPGKTIADIGCDHGLVSLYLIKEGIASHVIAMDVAEGPLESAQANIYEIESGKYEKNIELRLSDGFKALNTGETDSAIIAGMGGHLIMSILEQGIPMSSPGKKDNFIFTEGYEIVISPQSDIPLVRSFLRDNHFDIIDEDMLVEEGKYYNIIKAVFLTSDIINENDEVTQKIYDSFGEILIKKKSPVLRNYLEQELAKREGLFCRLSKKSTDNTVNRLAGLNEEIALIGRAMEMLGQVT